jgi:DNA-binding PadR family transcriptional regulator
MSLPHILLGLLQEPASGYDLKKHFGESLAHFWAAELSQIYPTLAKMEKDGLLESSRVASTKGPARKVYKRTAEGQELLREWLLDGPELRDERFSYMAQVFFLSELHDEEGALAYMQELRSETRRRLQELKLIEQSWRESDPRYPNSLPPETFYPQLTLALGLKRVAATLEWCDECIERIANRPD